MSGLRIGTFNTQLDSVIFKIAKDWRVFASELAASTISPPDNPFKKHAREMKNKAKQIARAIISGGFDYDVIALNEVFDEDARRVLFNDHDMMEKYPYRLRKYPEVVDPLPDGMFGVIGELLGDAVGPLLDTLGLALPDIGEDSGLMLFSRFPILDSQFKRFTFSNIPEMAAAAPDSLSAKGVAYARIFNPIMDETFNVFFTHMQENKEEWEYVRRSQLEQIEVFIRSLMTEEKIHNEDIFVLGDLNIIGNWEEVKPAWDLPGPKNIDNLERKAATKEWEGHLENPASFFTKTVHDAWFYETSTKDEGPKTYGGKGSRVDYILHNPEISPRTNLNPLRVQHLTKAYNLFSEEGKSLSDHYGLNVDLNRDAPNCSPRTSDPAGLTPTDGARILTSADGEYISGKLTYPGSMVWYRVDDEGTYSVTVLSKDVRFMIYQSTDLSSPLGQYKDETTEHTDANGEKFIAKKYVMVDPPFYVRVYHRNRDETADYALFVHKHAGANWEDAIALCPHKVYPTPTWIIESGVKKNVFPALFPKGKPINPEDTVYFEFDTLAADSRAAQDILCEVSEYSKAVFRMTLYDRHRIPVSGAATGPDPSKLTVKLNDVVPDDSTLCVDPSKIYLLVTRDDPTFSTDSFAVKWTTNLTVFHGHIVDGRPVPSAIPLLLHCDNETDPEWGVDEIIVRIWVDGDKKLDVLVGEFEAGDDGGLEKLIPPTGYRYLKQVVVQLFEQDHVSPDDPSDGKKFLTLDLHREVPNEQSDPYDFEDGLYSLFYNRSSYLTS